AARPMHPTAQRRYGEPAQRKSPARRPPRAGRWSRENWATHSVVSPAGYPPDRYVQVVLSAHRLRPADLAAPHADPGHTHRPVAGRRGTTAETDSRPGLPSADDNPGRRRNAPAGAPAWGWVR